MVKSFNGIAQCMPELGLLFYGADGSIGPSLLGLKLSDYKRKLIELKVQSGLGVGSRESRTINQSIKEGATDELALGFGRTGQEFSEMDDGYRDNFSWSLPLAAAIIYAMVSFPFPSQEL